MPSLSKRAGASQAHTMKLPRGKTSMEINALTSTEGSNQALAKMPDDNSRRPSTRARNDANKKQRRGRKHENDNKRRRTHASRAMSKKNCTNVATVGCARTNTKTRHALTARSNSSKCHDRHPASVQYVQFHGQGAGYHVGGPHPYQYRPRHPCRAPPGYAMKVDEVL